MWVFDRTTLRILEVNEAASQQYGYSRAEFLSLTLLDLSPSDEIVTSLRALVLDPWSAIVSRRWCHRSKNGTLFDVEITGREIRLDGHRAGIVSAEPIETVERVNCPDLVQELQ
jgi:PAS domain S-box-containing protein